MDYAWKKKLKENCLKRCGNLNLKELILSLLSVKFLNRKWKQPSVRQNPLLTFHLMPGEIRNMQIKWVFEQRLSSTEFHLFYYCYIFRAACLLMTNSRRNLCPSRRRKDNAGRTKTNLPIPLFHKARRLLYPLLEIQSSKTLWRWQSICSGIPRRLLFQTTSKFRIKFQMKIRNE